MRRIDCSVVAVLVLASCKLTVDPNVHRYSCTSDADCGSGWVCKAQFAGGSLCFNQTECKDTESCDGVDENCDGRVDETFAEKDQPCTTGLLGVCSTGTRQCLVGAIVCAQTTMASAEQCNQLDDDCNGQVDDGFDLATNSAHCGQCNHVCVTGTTCVASSCHETTCDDLIDNDLNGVTDCADPSCFGYACSLSLPPQGHCGVHTSDGGLVTLDAGTDAGADAGYVRACYPAESVCNDGLDDDGDTLVDCQDPDCDGRTCMSGTQCANRTCPGPG